LLKNSLFQLFAKKGGIRRVGEGGEEEEEQFADFSADFIFAFFSIQYTM